MIHKMVPEDTVELERALLHTDPSRYIAGE